MNQRPQDEDVAAPEPAPRATHCANCGAELRGEFCCECGQRAREFRLSFARFVGELAAEIFDSDSRLWRTLGPLALRPGFLSREYLDGRRVRYLPPLRLYLVASLLFFVLDGFLGAAIRISTDPVTDEPVAGSDSKVGQSGSAAEGVVPGLLRSRLQAMDSASFAAAFRERAPTAVFLTVPLFALITRLLWRGSQRWYTEHLIFALHLFAMVYLALSAGILIGAAGRQYALLGPASALLQRLLSAYLAWYWVLAFRNFLALPWLATLLRSALAALCYSLLLLATLALLSLLVLLAD